MRVQSVSSPVRARAWQAAMAAWSAYGPREPARCSATSRPHPYITGRGRVALVEYEVQHLEHGRQPGGQLDAAGDLERHARFAERPLGPDDALRDRRLRNEKRPGDLVGRETTQEAERKCHACLGREHRMAGGENQAQEIVADVIVD